MIVTDIEGQTEKFSLNRSYYGLYLPQLIWCHIENFSTNSFRLHLSSMKFSKEDYIRDFEIFKKSTK
ncbi:MAG: WxcM-like domain-containing protein [Flavobacterium sp.]